MKLIDGEDDPGVSELRRLWAEALWGAGMVGSVILIATLLAATMH
jgi:hypothetical protein